jgi:carboxylate-amine ligase
VPGPRQLAAIHRALRLPAGLRHRRGIKDLYWDVRPKPEFGTVEIRVCDTPLAIEQAIALAALAQSLCRWLLRTRPPLHTAKQAHVARYNKFQACRYGLDAMLSDPVALCQVSLRESLARLLDDISEDARELGCLHWLSPLKQMVVDNAATRPGCVPSSHSTATCTTWCAPPASA